MTELSPEQIAEIRRKLETQAWSYSTDTIWAIGALLDTLEAALQRETKLREVAEVVVFDAAGGDRHLHGGTWLEVFRALETRHMTPNFIELARVLSQTESALSDQPTEIADV